MVRHVYLYLQHGVYIQVQVVNLREGHITEKGVIRQMQGRRDSYSAGRGGRYKIVQDPPLMQQTCSHRPILHYLRLHTVWQSTIGFTYVYYLHVYHARHCLHNPGGRSFRYMMSICRDVSHVTSIRLGVRYIAIIILLSSHLQTYLWHLQTTTAKAYFFLALQPLYTIYIVQSSDMYIVHGAFEDIQITNMHILLVINII